MNRNSSLPKQQNSRFSESISKRNYSANILGKSLDKRFKFRQYAEPNKFGHGENSNNAYKDQFSNNKQMNVILEKEPYNPSKHNNLEKFLYLNQQLKENDFRRKTELRKVTSAKPNILKTKLSQKIGKILNENGNGNSGNSNNNTIHKYNYSNNYPGNIVLNSNINNYNNINSMNSNNNNMNNNTMNPKHFTMNKGVHGKTTINNINQFNHFLQNQNTYTNLVPPIFGNKKYVKPQSNKAYKEYYVKLIQNARDTMEDFHLIVEKFNGKENESLFGVFDGHGGIEVAQKLKDEIHAKFSKLLTSSPDLNSTSVVENSLKLLFKKLDDEIVKKYTVSTEFESTNFTSLGSTCTLVYLQKDKEISTLYCANVGDSRGVLISKTGFTRITYEHKPSDDLENKRIKNNGGVIFSGRIFGQFGLTRAFGNVPLKKWVIAEPFIKKIQLSENDRYVIIASDGVWDVISDKECFEYSFKYNNPKELCEELVSTAVSRWSKDNISCIVVKL